MRTWSTVALATVLATSFAPPRDAGADLKEQCAKVAAEKNYSFESTFESDAPSPGGARDAGAVDGKVEVGAAAEMKHNDVVAYRKSDKLVYKKKDAWELYTPPAAGGGRGGRYGGGGGGGGGDVKEMASLRAIASTPLPHELFPSLYTDLTDLKVTESDGKKTYTGTLTESAAMKLSGADKMRPPAPPKGAGGGGAKAPETKATGKATVVFGKDGSAEKLVVETHVKAQQGEFKTKLTVTMKEWGAVKVAMPKEAATKFNG
jgi:hypothetical protein